MPLKEAWIPAFAGMTALFPQYDTVSEEGGEGGGDFLWLRLRRAVIYRFL